MCESANPLAPLSSLFLSLAFAFVAQDPLQLRARRKVHALHGRRLDLGGQGLVWHERRSAGVQARVRNCLLVCALALRGAFHGELELVVVSLHDSSEFARRRGGHVAQTPASLLFLYQTEREAGQRVGWFISPK